MGTHYCTVFTPTYNRADLLDRLYQSLTVQEFKDFEWVIVDDGSQDNTTEVVATYIEEKKIDIKYIKVKNGGKHRAINKGLEICDGKVFAIVDSDDYLLPSALAKIHFWFGEIEKDGQMKYCGVSGCKGYNEKEIVGTTFQGSYIDATNIERKKYNITGDKFEVFYTEILRNYLFPTYEGENFMSEIVVWTRMAKDGYYIRWYQDIVYLCDYLEGGLTSNNFKVLSNNPNGYALRIREQVKYARIPLKERWGYYSNYYYLTKDKEKFRQMCKKLEVSYAEMLCAIILRFAIMLWRGNLSEYENI